jgi:hypothetical protein
VFILKLTFSKIKYINLLANVQKINYKYHNKFFYKLIFNNEI